MRAGLPRLFKSSFSGTRIPPHILLEAQAADAGYRVSLLNPLERPEPAWSYKTELLSSGGTDHVSRGVRGRAENLAETAGLAALKVVELPAESPASRLLRALQRYAIYTPNTPALRATVPDPQTRAPVGLSGGGLAEGFEAFKRAAGEELLDEVLALIDWVGEVSSTESAGALLSPAVPRARQVLRFTDRFMASSRNTLTAYDASEGALYVLFTALLCLSPASPPLFAIDSLDAALNPRLVIKLVAHLAGWLGDRQLLFTAHNPAVLDGLDLDDDAIRLFAVDRNSDGHTTVRRIVPSARLRELRAEYPLSRLWAMGHLGAVPNV